VTGAEIEADDPNSAIIRSPAGSSLHRNEPLSNGNTGAGCYGITAPVASLTTGKQEAIDPPSHDGNNSQQCMHGAKIGTTMPIVAKIRRPGPAGHYANGTGIPGV
jgi:hypothetical protein